MPYAGETHGMFGCITLHEALGEGKTRHSADAGVHKERGRGVVWCGVVAAAHNRPYQRDEMDGVSSVQAH
jgi:hypothetical protein